MCGLENYAERMYVNVNITSCAVNICTQCFPHIFIASMYAVDFHFSTDILTIKMA